MPSRSQLAAIRSAAARPAASGPPVVTNAAAYRSNAQTYSGGGGSNSLQAGAPAGRAVGDLLLLLVSIAGSGVASQSLSTPTGFTLFDGPIDSANPMRSWLFYRIADNTNTDTPLLSWGTTRFGGCINVAYSGVSTATPIEANGATNTAAGAATTIDSATALTVTNKATAVYLGVIGNNVAWGAHSAQGSEVSRFNVKSDYASFQDYDELWTPAASSVPTRTWAKGTGADAHMRTLIVRGI